MLDLQITGLKEARVLVGGVRDRAGNLLPVANALYGVAERDAASRFASSPSVKSTAQVYGGVQWENLTEAYLRSRRDRQGGKQLIDTGELRDSFKRGKPGNVATATGDTVTFGSNLPKAVGLNRKRPLLVVHPELIRQATIAYSDWIIRGTK